MATLRQRRWTITEQAQQLLGGLSIVIAGDRREAYWRAYHDAIDNGQSMPAPDAWRPMMSLMSLLSHKEVLLLIEGLQTDDPAILQREIAKVITKDVADMLPLGREGISVRLCSGPDCSHDDGDHSHTLRVYYGPQG